jgi:rRNA maturation protein Nop10
MIKWICSDCGLRFGEWRPVAATWHMGQCDICGTQTAVTEPRDFQLRRTDMSIITEQCPVCGEQTFNCVFTDEGVFCYCVNPACGHKEESDE